MVGMDIKMTPKEVYDYFGSQYKFHKETGLAQATLHNWLKWGRIPEDAQYKLERITKGKLKTEWTKSE